MKHSQEELEREQIEAGKKRYFKKVAEAEKVATLSEVKAGHWLTLKAVDALAPAIVEWCEKVERGWSSRYGHLQKYLREFNPRLAAFFVAKAVVNNLAKPVPMTKLAFGIAQMFEDHANYMKFKLESKEKWLVTNRKIRKSNTYHYRAYVTKRMARYAGVSQEDWGRADRERLGICLIELFVEKTGLAVVDSKPSSNGKAEHRVYMVLASELGKELLQKFHDRCALLDPAYLPMVEPPMPWTAPDKGGYRFRKARPLYFMKTHNKRYIDEMRFKDLSSVYAAMNAVQDTPWMVNRKVLEVLDYAWSNGGGGDQWGLPDTKKRDLPHCPVCFGAITAGESHPCFEKDEESLKEWKGEASRTYLENQRIESQQFQLVTQIRLARKFSDEERLYFPVTLDWRGRMYPVPPVLNPQGDETSRALLMFADGKPLTSRGYDWLRIHTANCMDEDPDTGEKIANKSFEYRIQWVEDHQDIIHEVAQNPLDCRYWTKAEKPYSFLAACFELDGYWQNPNAFMSRLPIGMDGSCNGLQNFAAMLKDYESGYHVNLIPAEQPQDIYTKVAEIAGKMVEQDAANGVEHADKWVGKVNRKIVKRNVMTIPYSSTLKGRCGQILDELRKWKDKGKELPVGTNDWHGAYYLTMVIDRAIATVTPAAVHAMEFLKECSKAACSRNNAVRWMTPMGLVVEQRYPKTVMHRFKCILGNVLLMPAIYAEARELDKQKMTQSISPNFVHSMDAAHLQHTVNKAYAAGIRSFAMIHDSYGTHASDADKLAEILRAAFIEIYKKDVLAQFRRDLMSAVKDDKDLKAFPEPLPRGTLDLLNILKSKYFFA